MHGHTSSGLVLSALALGSILCSTSTAAAFGESVDGLPSWEERMLHAWVNRARLDPAADLAGCAACADKDCYAAKQPLVYHPTLNRAARLHAIEMALMGAAGRDSACTLVPDIGAKFPAACDGSPGCACVGGSAGCAPQCTTWQERVQLFGVAGAHEVLGTGSSPLAAFDDWMREPWSGGCGTSPENRGTLLTATGAIGFGVAGTSVVADLSATEPSVAWPIVAGSHFPRLGGALTFHAIWNDGWAAKSAAVDIDGTCYAMTRERGSPYLGSWTAALTVPAASCRRYYFVFRNESFAVKTWPETGSLGIGDAACADFDTARPLLPSACPCIPVCDEKQCGEDECGGSCGACAAGEECLSGSCVTGDAGLDASEDGSAPDGQADGPGEAAAEAQPFDAGEEVSADSGEDGSADSGAEDAEAGGGAGGGDGAAGSSEKPGRKPKVAAGQSIADSADEMSCATSAAGRSSAVSLAAVVFALALVARRRSRRPGRWPAFALIACSAAFLCGADGGAPKPLGSSCHAAGECESQFCVDNVCCESACDKQCEACSSAGLCEPGSGDPRSPRPPCPAAKDPSCAAVCDGTQRDSCTFPEGPRQDCDDNVGCEGRMVTMQRCDGAGECKATGRVDCAPYTCWAARCTDECTNDSECAPTGYCEGYQCHARTATRCDGTVQVDTDGTRTECSPARCQADSGTCVRACASDTDCVGGSVCRDTACVLLSSRPRVSMYDEDGCNCSAAGRASPPHWAAFSIAGLTLSLVLRRRRSRTRLRSASALASLILVIGCSAQEALPPGEVCEDVGYSISNRILTCTGDQELAVERWEGFRNEYQCLVKTVDRSIEEYYVCPVEVRKTPCETVTAAGRDLDLWLGSVPVCTEILAHTSGERIPENGSQP